MIRSGVRRRLASGDGLAAALGVAVVLAALLVRLDGLGERSFGHPENYIAGVPMPDWVHPNARRLDLFGVLNGMRTDGHPPLYFALLLGWTSLFGHGLVALRLPSVLAGAASVALVYRLALRVGDRWTALLAAALVAASGLHVYWSQLARMYALASLLVLASTLLLVRLHEAPRPALAWGYGLTTAAALWTQLYAWPAVAAQALWLAWRGGRRRGGVPTAVPPLACALVAAAPVAAQLLHRTANVIEFRQEPWGFFALGHAFSRALPFWGPAPAAPVPAAWLTAATVALGAVALVRPPRPALAADGQGETLAARPGRGAFAGLATFALASALATWRFARWVVPPGEARPEVLACALAPLVVAGATCALLARAKPRREPTPASQAGATGLVAVLAVAPLLLMAAISRYQGAMVDRGTVVFVPYLLVLVAAGARASGRRAALPVLVAASLLAVSVASLAHYRRAEATPRDYAGLARALDERLQPHDLVVVRDDYRGPPLLYYFPERAWSRFVLARDVAPVVRERRPERMWIVTWKNALSGDEPRLRLRGYRLAGEVSGRHAARARLWERVSSSLPSAAGEQSRRRSPPDTASPVADIAE